MNTLDIQTSTGTDIGQTLAGTGSRAYGYIIDWHIRVAAVLLWLLCCALVLRAMDLWPLFGEALLEHAGSALWVLFAPAGLLYTLYHPVVELIMGGDSPGKRMAGITVVDRQGLPPGPGPVLTRNVLRLVDGLPAFYVVGIVCTLTTREHVRVGDMLAGTRVIVAPERAERAVAHMARIDAASVDAESAELVVELLDRWPGLSRKRRRELAERLLQRLGLSAEDTDRKLKAQLKALLESS